MIEPRRREAHEGRLDVILPSRSRNPAFSAPSSPPTSGWKTSTRLRSQPRLRSQTVTCDIWWHTRPTDGPFAAERPRSPEHGGITSWTWLTILTDLIRWTAARRSRSIRTWKRGTVSNCMACHARAACPPQGALPVPNGPVREVYLVSWYGEAMRLRVLTTRIRTTSSIRNSCGASAAS